MFNKRENKNFDIIVGLSSTITGDIKSEGSIRIDGKITGEIISSGDVIIGDQAVVEANIEAEYCEISGMVTGNVHTDTQLKIFKSGTLNGDIKVSSFTIEEGGIFSGNCDINPDKKIQKDKHKNKPQPEKEKHSDKDKQEHQKKNYDSNNHKK